MEKCPRLHGFLEWVNIHLISFYSMFRYLISFTFLGDDNDVNSSVQWNVALSLFISSILLSCYRRY